MAKNAAKNLSEVFVLIILQVIRIHFREWGVVVVVCRPRRGMSMLIIPQVIRISYLKFSEWQREVVVRPRRGVKIVVLWYYNSYNYNYNYNEE